MLNKINRDGTLNCQIATCRRRIRPKSTSLYQNTIGTSASADEEDHPESLNINFFYVPNIVILFHYFVLLIFWQPRPQKQENKPSSSNKIQAN